ncbi:MAG: exodeoxyribonuclease VII large subunit [Fidelibacterota bacterium]|nr:MAG: exodeoxyribonuclease VII large subunit [Candidatus Neomarinimicrobiota bacterium]
MSPTGQMNVLSVSELNRKAKQLLESHFVTVWVEGEISNFKHHTSGHMYFVLKDERAELAAVMFSSSNVALRFRPANGQKVLARGTLTVYEARGQYQIVVQNLYPSGAGELWLAFETLKERLKDEGLFDPDRKQALPGFPRRIGVITSPTGAAIRDIIQVLGRRAPHVILMVRPTLVQGEGAAEDIVAALADFTAYGEVDLVILARGGGSLEDLWPFNEEIVARAVAACPLPTLSAVGHETDVTICDMVADERAPTPSAAIQIATGEREGYLQHIDERMTALEAGMHRRLRDARQRLIQLEQRYAFRQPLNLIGRERERLRQLAVGLELGIERLMEHKTGVLNVALTGLQALNPERVLQRGYAILSDDKTGKVVTHTEQLTLKQSITLHLQDGEAGAEVTRLGKPSGDSNE